MTTSPEQPQTIRPTRRRRWPLIVLAMLVGLIVLGAAGFVGVSALEERDTFCISCHTVPETTYFNRAYIALDNPTDVVTDLATAHYHIAQSKNLEPFACIDCHRGDGSLGHRISTLALGGRDAVIYVLGRENPTIEKTSTVEGWLPNAACINCHADTLLTLKGLDNHFHTHLPQAAAALARGGTLKVPDTLAAQRTELLNIGLKTINTSLVCSDCHQAHVTEPTGAATFFMDTDRRNQSCVTCHHAAKEGPQDANRLK
jgi:nitrate/TMAO reductase-like tetraheme cytochrome c subunit